MDDAETLAAIKRVLATDNMVYISASVEPLQYHEPKDQGSITIDGTFYAAQADIDVLSEFLELKGP